MRPLTKPEFYAAILVLARDSVMSTSRSSMENAWGIYQSPEADYDAYRKRVRDAFAGEFDTVTDDEMPPERKP